MKIPPQAKKVFSGKIFDTYQWEQEMFDGTFQTFEMLKRADTVSVIATCGDKILIIEDEQPNRGALRCLPGGRIEENENPETGAARELLEETGYAGTRWKLLSTSDPYNKMEWTMHTFVAEQVERVEDQHLDPGERIKVSLISFGEFVALARDATFRVPNDIRQMLWEALLDNNKKTELQNKLGL